jgi:hypothetical protein
MVKVLQMVDGIVQQSLKRLSMESTMSTAVSPRYRVFRLRKAGSKLLRRTTAFQSHSRSAGKNISGKR